MLSPTSTLTLTQLFYFKITIMDLELPKPNVTFDDDCNLRILNPELRERSTHLADECKLLVSSK